MKRNSNVEHYLDDNNEHRARVVAANGEPLFISSEGYTQLDDLIIGQELTRQALNAAYYANMRRVDEAMATRKGPAAVYRAQDMVGTRESVLFNSGEALSGECSAD
jgi:uncharacterized protein YegP (UPF0339 family)